MLVGLLLLLTALPLRAQPTDPYAGLPESQSLQGFPDIGYPSALVNLTLYVAYDDPASAQFWTQTLPQLMPRVQSGEIRLIAVPLFGGGSIAGGRAAARAAICANEQGKFWQYSDQLFALQSSGADDALASARLLTAATDLGLDTNQWTACLNGSGPDAILDDAAQAANSDPTFTATPYILVGGSPSLTDIDSLNFTIDLALQRASDELAQQSVDVTPEATDVDVYTFDPLAHDPVEPPLTLALPAGWSYGYDALVLQDIDGIRSVPFAIYQGPITGGTGHIVLLWGFPNLIVGAPAGGLVQPDIWTDATRLLRLAIFEEGCNVGTDLRRNYSVGGMQAVGTQFAAVDCPEFPDARGWFAGLRQFNINFVFYVYTDPIEAMDSEASQQDLQAILDTVQFVLPQVTPEPTS